MANNLDKFVSASMEGGLDHYNQDFSAELLMATGSKNLSSGINSGLGPRSGMAPIPGQQHTQGNTSTEALGLRQCEGASSNFSYRGRTKVLGCFPLTANFFGQTVTTYNVPKRYYVWLVGNASDGTSSIEKVDVVISSVVVSSGTNYVYPNPDFASGLNYSLTNPSSFTYNADDIPFLRINMAGTTAASIPTYLSGYFGPYTKHYISAVVVSVAGGNIPCEWLAANKISDLTANTPGTYNFQRAATGSGTGRRHLGSPSAIQMNTDKKDTHGVKVYNLFTDATYGLGLAYSYHYDGITFGDSTYVGAPDNGAGSQWVPGVNASTRVVRRDATAPAAASVDGPILHNDHEMFNNSAYKAVIFAGKKPMAMVIQGWNRGQDGYPFQIIDLTSQRFKPVSAITLDHFSAVNAEYTEEGVRQNTCWFTWPQFAQGTPLTAAAANPRVSTTASATNTCVALGAAGSGVLRANTTYEFTYSVYDKWLGYETNVGAPGKIRTGADDFVRISLFRDIIVAATYRQSVAGYGNAGVFRNEGPLGRGYPINQIEYRVYYRELGSYEWLPALFIDAAKYHLYPEFQDGLWACEAPIAGLPGGQPGGFIDYSEIPDDTYDCVLYYKNRVFCLSATNMVFSLANNIFAYPLRNAAPAPTGGYKGAIVHTYRGDSEQQSRLVIFGGSETYIGKFTGQFTQMPIVVSPETIENYDVDGSDFRIESWTSITAFSHRSAVVADGDLYWWGPQGIYFDDGVANPEKISLSLEPNIFSYYDPSKIEEIHCVYNDRTKEITWYYPPKDASTITYGLVYNTVTEQFYPQEWGCKIDWAQTINTEGTQGTNGFRTIVGVRQTSASTLQRAYFADAVNRSGDLEPTTEFVVKTVATSGVNKVLTLATGYDSTNFNTIAAADYIAIQQFKSYTGESTGDDMITKVVSTSAGAGTITVKLPTGATLPDVTITDTTKYFPIWHRSGTSTGLNGFDYELRTKYWSPSGPNYSGIWQYVYMFFKYTTWKKVDANTFSFAYRTPSGGDFITDTITFSDNSDANFQVYHALRQGLLNNQGQAIKLKLSGVHIGEAWVLQYLEAQASEETGNLLKQYQG